MTEYFQPIHRRVIAGIVGVILLLLVMASCSPRPQVAYGTAPAVVQQAPMVGVAQAPAVVVAPAHHSGFGDAFAGSMLGSMVGNAFGNRGTSSHTTVVERHVQAPTVTTTAPAQRYATPAYRPPAPTTYQSSRGVSTSVFSRPSTFGSSTRSSISVGRRR